MEAGAAIGARLRRLSELLDGDAKQLYEERDIAFEQRWHGLLDQIARNGAMTVGELAQALHISHASVSQARQSLEKTGLVVHLADPADGRERRIDLSAKGRKFVDAVTPLWRALEAASLELDDESRGVAAALDRLADALERQSLLERARRRLAAFSGPARSRR